MKNSRKTSYCTLTKTDYNCLFGRIYFTSNNGSQNTPVYQPTLRTLELKKDKGTDYVLSWKSDEVYNSELKRLYAVFFHCMNLSGYRMGIGFYKDPLSAEEKNYATKIINVYLVYDLDVWPIISPNTFKFKNCLFGASSVVKNSDKE